MKTMICFSIFCLVTFILPSSLLAETGEKKNVRNIKPVAVVVETNAGGIDVQFNGNFGWVDITLETEEGVLLISQTLDTSLQSKTSIYTSRLSGGIYILTANIQHGTILTREPVQIAH